MVVYPPMIPLFITYTAIFFVSLYLFSIIAHYLLHYSLHMTLNYLYGEQLVEQFGYHFYSKMGLFEYIFFPVLWCFIWSYMLTHHPFRFIISLPVRIWKFRHHKLDLFGICAKIGTPAVPILIKVFGRYFQKLEINRSAGITLGKIGDQMARKVLTTAILKGDDSAVDGLMEIGDCGELEELINSLEDNTKCKNPILVAKVLGRLGRKEGITYLKKISATIDQSDRFQAIKALAEIGSPESLYFLIKASEDNNSKVATNTIENIATITNEKALPQLIMILADKSYKHNLREAVAKSLGLIGSTEAAISLLEVMKNKELELSTRITAIKSLGQIGGSKISENLIQFLNREGINTEIKDEIINALKLIRDDTAIKYFLKRYKEHNEMEYIDKVEILAWSNVPEDIDSLKRELKDPKISMEYKMKLANALGENTRDPEIIPFTIYRGKAIDYQSIRTLGQIADFKGFYPILKKLRNLDYYSWKLCFPEAEKALEKIVNNCNDIKKLHRASRYLWRQLTVGPPLDQLHSHVLELTSNQIAYLKVKKIKL